MTALIRIVAIVALAGAAACGGGMRPVAVPGAGDATITSGALNAIKARWNQVELGPAPGAPCPTATGPAPVLAEADFNGDGEADTALWIDAGGISRLVVLFARLDGEYVAVEVGGGATAPSGALEVGGRGTSYQLATLSVDSYFRMDTVFLHACDGTRTAWFWTGSTFAPQTLAR